MGDPLLYPKLRWPLDLRMEKIDSGDCLFIRCPLGITEAPLFLIPEVAPILTQFDGTNSLESIVAKFEAQGLTKDIVTGLVTLLDTNYFLSTPRFYEAEARIKENFISADLRPAALAGRSYPSTPNELSALIDGYLMQGKEITTELKPENLISIMSPHIDYHRGGLSYGATYKALRNTSHDLYIIIGTSHQYSRLLFHLTKKDFATPLGRLVTDKEFVTKLGNLYGSERSFRDELLHKNEHSLELQTPFLARLIKSPTIVPILVGGFHEYLASGKDPSAFDEYESFISALTECVKERSDRGQRVCVIAGVDMAHVGRTFGDPGQLTPEYMEMIEQRDKIYLDSILNQNKASMYAHMAEDQDARRICGFPTMYTVIDLYDRLGIKYKGSLFEYRQAVDYTSDCAVTLAGIGLYH